MKLSSLLLGFLAVAALAVSTSYTIQAAMNHSFISDYTDATTCLGCHEEEGQDFMATIHWDWVHGEGDDALGKQSVINNYCIAISSNEPRCTSCHAGVGWRDDTFDFTDSSKIDCLVCHDGTGTYKKVPTGAGIPDPGVDLLAVAKSVGSEPTRTACGTCHFTGGGGDGVKHGTMDTTLKTPSREVDVHMYGAEYDEGRSCTFCHQADKHVMPGSRYAKDTPDSMLCESCHGTTPHESSRLNSHVAARVSCQACHIPAMARGDKATKLWWDWSKAGQKNPDGSLIVIKDDDGNEIYNTKKGEFVWGRNVVPEYVWVNGQVDYVTLDTAVTGDEVVTINQLQGSIDDPNARIMPVKRFQGIQPYDAVNGTLAIPHLFPYNAEDTTAYWKSYDWNACLTEGMNSVGRTFGGEVGWVESEMFWVQNHMVAPKEQAVQCSECHSARGRLDFLGLGYPEDEAIALGTMMGFEVDPVAPDPAGGWQLSWIGTAGNSYQVEYSDLADFPNWQPGQDGSFTVEPGADPTELTWSDPNQQSGRLYRIVRN